jgi:exonuclease SbcD
MKLDYDNTRTRKYNDSFDGDIEQRQEKQPIELFEELYELQNNQQMDNEQREYINHIIEEIWV